MISEELQFQIHNGDTEAFKTLYNQNAKRIYLAALRELNDESNAKRITKSVFLQFRQELVDAPGPLDGDARLEALLLEQIRMQEAETQTAQIIDSVAEQLAPVVHAPAVQTMQSVQEAPAQPEEFADRQAMTSFAPGPAIPSSVPHPIPPVATPPKPEPPAAAEPEKPVLEQVLDHMERELPPRQYRKMRKSPRWKDDEVFDQGTSSGGTWLITVLIVLFLLLFLWVLTGILMDLAVLPFYDLGFTWFNANVFPLFRLQ